MNPGMKTIELLFSEQLRVDDKWSVRRRTAFDGGLDRNEQTVEVVGQEPGKTEKLAISSQFEPSCYVPFTWVIHELKVINALLMAFASMAGPVYNKEAKTLSLCSFRLRRRLWKPICPSSSG